MMNGSGCNNRIDGGQWRPAPFHFVGQQSPSIDYGLVHRKHSSCKTIPQIDLQPCFELDPPPAFR